MGAKRLLRPAVSATVCVVLTAFGGTGLAVTLRSAPSPAAAPSAVPVSPVRFQTFELPGETLPTASPTVRPVVKKKKVAPKKVVVRATPKPATPPHRRRRQPCRQRPSRHRSPSSSRPKASGTGQNNTALLIGINKAPGSDVLQGMVEDTKTMRTMLLRAGYKSENIKVLTDKHATKAAILQALDSLARRTSGKGTAVVSISSHSGISGGDMTFATGGGGRVSRAELASRLAKVRGRLWTTISTCYSAAYDTPGITGSNRIAMFTASKDELSYQNAAGSLSIVYMVQRGDARARHPLRRGRVRVRVVAAARRQALRSKVPILKDGIPGDVVLGRAALASARLSAPRGRRCRSSDVCGRRLASSPSRSRSSRASRRRSASASRSR